MIAFKTLLRFSRPHTITGSVISITTLYIMACGHNGLASHLPLLLISLVTGICCNIFIVGINQIADIELDRINKPQLPLASGELTLRGAYLIIYIAAFITVFLAAYISFILLGVVMLSMFIGLAYSLPPFNFKKHHLPAAIAISTVRGLLVNLGGFYVFTLKIYGNSYLSNDILILTMFILVFTIAIAWFKDMPDMEGDARYQIRSFTLLYTPAKTLLAGTLLVSMAYLVSIFYYANGSSGNTKAFFVLTYGHVLLLLLNLVSAKFTNTKEHTSLKKFYKRFWLFFFAEYALYLIAFI